eukprot:1645985-Rhodomonas_salina.1
MSHLQTRGLKTAWQATCPYLGTFWRDLRLCWREGHCRPRCLMLKLPPTTRSHTGAALQSSMPQFGCCINSPRGGMCLSGTRM